MPDTWARLFLIDVDLSLGVVLDGGGDGDGSNDTRECSLRR
jgi:hypothetical protein